MPRQARIDAPGALHHVIARGIERGKIFHDDTDREDFLDRLGKVIQQTQTKCYAWALIPNHFHLLLKTGKDPIATVMRRLLTGYASGFNRRHSRSGHLFQNRYRSILCQEDAYLKELVRYIHLNPMRARVVKNLAALDEYPYASHSILLREHSREWQSTDSVLSLFGRKASVARKKYREFIEEGVGQGRRPELIGGGLIRSAGGWAGIQVLRKTGGFQKSDERILGDGDFVESVLAEADERLEQKYALRAMGLTLEKLQQIAENLAGVRPDGMIGNSKTSKVVLARKVFCYWASRELGFTLTEIAGKLKLSVSTVSGAVQKGEELIQKEALKIENFLNVKI